MGVWRDWLTLNHTIILFVYGQVFFVLGLAIFWQSRQHSQLDLARSLGWLGAFGLIHAAHEWGDIFIPIQAGFLSPEWVDMLRLLQSILLAVSYLCLFQFGAETLISPLPRLRWLRAVSGGLLILWMATFMWASEVSRWDAIRTVTYARVWARYALGLPGAIVAALGLREQTRGHGPLLEFAPHDRPFRVASLVLAFYAVLGGLIVPPAPFFPANVINSTAVFELLGIPIQVLRSLAGLILTASIVRGLEVFQMEVDRRLDEMAHSQLLLAERQRISRELHDGAIQTLYTAGLIAESMRHKIADTDPLAASLDRVISALQHAIRDLRQFIVELEPQPSAINLVEELRKLAKDPYLSSLIQVQIDISPEIAARVSPVQTTHVLAIVKEALSNVVRHAQARHVWIEAQRRDGQLQITVADDGIGLRAEQPAGFGLRNMRDRARLLSGTLRIVPRLPTGTAVTLIVPLDDRR